MKSCEKFGLHHLQVDAIVVLNCNEICIYLNNLLTHTVKNCNLHTRKIIRNVNRNLNSLSGNAYRSAVARVVMIFTNALIHQVRIYTKCELVLGISHNAFTVVK